MNSKAALVLSYAIVVVGVLNLLFFLAHVSYLGGSALNGKVEGGRFLLENKGHYVQVSESVFRWCSWHEKSIIYTQLAAIAAGVNVHRIRDRRRAA